MTDIWSRSKRSEVMSRIRGTDTLPEMKIRKILTAAGLRYRVHPSGVPGKPDVAFPRSKLAVFVHGCFWHGCPEHYSAPKSNAGFWKRKLAENRRRDAAALDHLMAQGWTVLQFWEHQIAANPVSCAAEIKLTLEELSADSSKSRARGTPQAKAERRSRSG